MHTNPLASLAAGYAMPKPAVQKRQLSPLEQAEREGEQMAMAHAQQMGLPPPPPKSSVQKQIDPQFAGAFGGVTGGMPKPMPQPVQQRPMQQQPMPAAPVMGGGVGRVRKQPVVMNPGTSFSYRRG